ncbi:P-loop containing nucleoside triphosphate hydrolase protein [Zopfochytrium polystomum]|nr:P-loop containing nucleoside triphosphate hydrolase protein [Zopfochytrium polystomum]
MQNRGRQRLRLHGDVEATVPPGVPGFGSPTTSVAFDKLIEAGIRSEMDLLVTSEDYIMANTDLDRLTIDRMRMLVAKRNSCPSLSAVEALAAEKKTRKLLTSGCPGIDVLLGHGLKSGDIVEFAGPPSTGKSQLAFFATVAALATRPTGTVLFVDSCGSFSPDRLQHMFSESDRFTRHRESMTPSGLFSRLRCVECFDSFEFIGILYSLQHLLAAKESDFFKNLMLIVIDSIGALLSPVVGDGRGQAVVETVGRMLKMISVVHGAPIMTVNYAVTNFSRKNELSRPKQKPALGHAWAEVPTTTLFFSKPTSATREELDEAVAAAEVGRARGDGAAGLKSGNGTGSVRVSTYTNQRGVDIQVKTRKVEVLRSPDEKLKGAWRYLYLGQGEVISFEEEDQ